MEIQPNFPRNSLEGARGMVYTCSGRRETAMKIVVLDGFTLNPGDISWSGFLELGEFILHDRTPPGDIIPRIGDAEAVITNKTPVTRETMAACPNLKYVGELATGYNNVDTKAARERGITVTNIPAYGTMGVAQFTFALLLEVCHRVGHHAKSVRNGRWNESTDFCYWDFPLIELAGKTMGLVGFGRIGRAVAGIAVAMGMRVLAHDVKRDAALETESVRYAELDEVYAASDVLSLHAPLFDSTREMINADSIRRMKRGVIIVNTARGGLVAEEDLADALMDARVSAYASDVATTEPISPDSPLLAAKNCILTPHIAWAPREARIRLMKTAVDNLAAFIKGAPVNVVS